MSRFSWRLGAAAVASAAVAAAVLWRGRSLPSSLSHLRPGRRWEYDISPEGGTETTVVRESFLLPDGRRAYRLEFYRDETLTDAVFTSNQQGHLIQLSQSGGTATFEPPLVGLGDLRVGASWSTRASMIMPSKFRAATPTEVSGRVVGFEQVTVPAGTFGAFRIEQVCNGRASTAWHVPAVGMVREASWGEELVLRALTEESD